MAGTGEDDQATRWKRYDEILSNEVNPERLVELYAQVARMYDQDMGVLTASRGKLVRDLVEELFGNDRTIRILDVGAGTGTAGEEFKAMGYKNVDAVDACDEMLKVAKSKNLYNRLICDYVGKTKLDIEDGTYDFLMCIGSLLGTHINEDGFEEMIRITKQGGYIAFIVGCNSLGSAKPHIDQCMQGLHETGRWNWIIRRTVPGYLTPDESVVNTHGIQYVFRIPDNQR